MPEDVFGPEPAHRWCYYFERADLARQFGEWDQVLKLWEEAGPLASQARYGPEYLPFIEAFARSDHWDKAVDLTLKADAKTAGMSGFLCSNWARMMQETPASEAKTASWAKLQTAVACAQTQPENP